jgi:sec-independent protein translocase protein TatC
MRAKNNKAMEGSEAGRRRKNPEKAMTILDHLQELRNRFIVSLLSFLGAAIVALVFYDTIIDLFTSQFESIQSGLGASLFSSSIAEGFIVQLKTAAISGLILSLPVHLVNAIAFIFPGIDKKYRRIIVACLVVSFFLAAFGAYLAYFRIIPFSIRFLTNSIFIPKRVGILLNYQQSTSYVLSFMLWAIITFQFPLVLEILLALKLLKRKAVFRAGRYVIVGIVVLSAVVTPSVDPVSQLSIALPLVVLFYAALLVAKLFKWGED